MSQNVGMGKKKPGRHGVASMRDIASQVLEISKQISAIAENAKDPPTIEGEIVVMLEASLEDGLLFLQGWTNELRTAVTNEKRRLTLAAESAVSASAAPVSDSPPPPRKNRRK